MYAMHYAITLPADYDMAVIRERIATKAPLLDNLPGLGLKAYLIREKGRDGATVNQYATFYLWASADGMAGFLWGGGGFQGIVASFGRPSVRHWVGAGCFSGSEMLEHATIATIREEIMEPEADPRDPVAAAVQAARRRAGDDGCCLAAVAVDPRDWRIAIFCLWAKAPAEADGTPYKVGHISRPELAAILAER